MWTLEKSRAEEADGVSVGAYPRRDRVEARASLSSLIGVHPRALKCRVATGSGFRASVIGTFGWSPVSDPSSSSLSRRRPKWD